MKVKEVWSLTILYDDETSRERAREFCDSLVQRFWIQNQFEIHWYAFKQLSHRQSAQEAAQNAVRANLLIFAARPQDEIPFSVREWVEAWQAQRGEREGALVGLFGPENESKGSAKHIYLREVAHRAGMDYLTQVPETIAEPMPDSIESYAARADCVTSVLDEILRQNPLPPHIQTS
ncbi:MAG: hypothetical protein C5B50_24250 [Verrucomicrobia bacterium]|nr:MAG: hypothetical protein C5B50_24250 [Verrucomicrobiota bacterium]